MEKVAIVGCGAYMDTGYGCAGEWRCLKAAALGEGTFENPSQVIDFVNVNARAGPLLPIWAWRLKCRN
jgi:predicted metal-binding protein